MYQGTLTDKKSGLNISYTYKKRGMDKPYPPDYIKEREEKESYTLTDSLFTGFVGFDGRNLLYRAVDIVLDLGKICFVDTLSLSLGEEARIEKIEFFIREASRPKLVGKYLGEGKDFIKADEISIPLGISTDNLIIRLQSSCTHIVVGKLKLTGAVNLDEVIYPSPRHIKLEDGYMSRIDYVIADTEDEAFAAKYFMEKASICNNIADDNCLPRLEGGGRGVAWCRDMRAVSDTKYTLRFKLSDLPENSYTVSVSGQSAIVCGGSRLALLWGAEKLRQICCRDGVRLCYIEDSPYMELRGVHIALPDRDKIDFLKSFVKNFLVPLGYNTVFIQLSATMEYKRHPEINSSWLEAVEMHEKGLIPKPAHYEFLSHDVLSHEEVSDICEYIRSYGLDVIPEVQTLGHTQYITMSYPELGEIEKKSKNDIDLYTEDVKQEDYYIHCMCPIHEDYYKMTFDIIDEVIEVVKPAKYLHIGHDEIYTIGKCPRCRDIPAHIIYADEVNKLNQYVKSKGLTTMLWSDMIQEEKYETKKAIDLIDKDIICLSFTWYFHLNEDVEDMLHERGFNVMLGNFYSSHYPRFTKRKKKGKLLGAEISTWVWCNELSYAFDGKLYDIMYCAEMLWNEDFNEELRLTYNEIIKNMYPSYGKYLGDGYIEGESQKVYFPGNETQVPYDIRHEYKSALAVGYGEVCTFDTDIKAKKLSFLHSTDTNGERIVWETPKEHGVYTLSYDDGTKYNIAILYGANINEYKCRYGEPIYSDMYRHEGYTATCLALPHTGKTMGGEDYTLLEYTISNPYPEKRIKSISLTHSGDTDAKIILYEIKTEVSL